MTLDNWKAEVARIFIGYDFTAEQATEIAESVVDAGGYEDGLTPQEAVDEELSYWGD
jgi:hypothetical protein